MTEQEILRRFYGGEAPKMIAISLRLENDRLSETEAREKVSRVIVHLGGHYREFKETGKIVLPESYQR